MNAEITGGKWTFGRQNLKPKNDLDVWATVQDSTGAYITVAVLSNATCENEADARLIAAAPDLLAFAQAYCEMWPASGEEDILYTQAKAAIARATGQA